MRHGSPPPIASMGRLVQRYGWVSLVAGVVVGSLLLNVQNNDFPPYYHMDELHKCNFIRQGGSNYMHPLLMLDVNRLINCFLGYREDQDVIELGRTVSAFFGALTTLLSCLIGLQLLGRWRALLLAATVALSPLLVVHAHYLKEDAIFTAWCTASLLAAIRFFAAPSRKGKILFGLAMGLCFSSKYPGFLLVPMALLIPWVGGLPDRRQAYKDIVQAILLGIGVFVGIHARVLFDLSSFFEGVAFETRHIIEGHEVYISPLHNGFAFHLLNSLVPGMTWFVVLPALGFLVSVPFRWRAIGLEERILLLFFFVYYVSIEITPMKAFPDYTRYAAPIVPITAFFALRGAMELAGLATLKRRLLLECVLAIVIVIPAAVDSLLLVRYLNQDTRQELERFLTDHPGEFLSEPYAARKGSTFALAQLTKKGKAIPADTRYLVASSFVYDRYLRAASLGDNREDIAASAQFYRQLFSYPYVEIRPAHRSYAFTNPVLRIFAIVDVFAEGEKENAALGIRRQ